MQNELLLNWYLSAYCTQKLDHLQPPLADILRIGAYQILFLDKVPDHAAVSESVELCRTNGRSAASRLVNAVLRKVAQNKSNLPPLPEEYRTIERRLQPPAVARQKLVSLLGTEEAEAFLRIDNEASPISVQVNPLKTNEKALVDELRGEGVCVTPHPWVPDAWAFRHGRPNDAQRFLQWPLHRTGRGGTPDRLRRGLCARAEGAGRLRRSGRQVVRRGIRDGKRGEHPLVRST